MFALNDSPPNTFNPLDKKIKASDKQTDQENATVQTNTALNTKPDINAQLQLW